MFNWLEIYLWLRLDGIKEGLGVIILLYIVWSVILILAFFLLDRDELKDMEIYRHYKKVSIIGLSCLLLYVLLPSTKDFAMIYLLPKLTNSKTVQTLLKNSDDIEKILKKYIKEKYSKKINSGKQD